MPITNKNLKVLRIQILISYGAYSWEVWSLEQKNDDKNILLGLSVLYILISWSNAVI